MIRLALALLATASVLPSVVLAADIPEPIPVIEPDYSNWYIRADVGYVFKSKSGGNWAFYNIFPGVEGIDDYYRYDDLRLDSAPSFGGGVGYRFSDMFRVDATLDYFNADVNGKTKCPLMITTSNGTGPFDECNYNDSSEVDVWNLMANAYVDLPSLGIVTPYIGAGVGAAYVEYGRNSSREVCPPCDPTTPRYTGENEGLDDWRFASSLMAGASVDLTQNLALDLGYKFTKIWGGDAWKFDEQDQEFGATGAQLEDDGFEIHSLRAGLRYSFY